jgi:nucleoside-diphosphate-sugar epimerase
MATLVCLGLGYCARHYVGEFGARFDRVIGTTRSAERAAALGRQRMGGRAVEMLIFDGRAGSRELSAAVSEADALLVSAAPADGRDPVLTVLADEIAHAPRLRSAVFLSTLGVYGDSGGAWIDETAETIPTLARRGSARIDAELAWRALGGTTEAAGRHPPARGDLWPGTERDGQAAARHRPSCRQARACLQPHPCL